MLFETRRLGGHLLFDVAAEVLQTIAADRKHLDELPHPMRSKGWGFTGAIGARLGQFLARY